MKRILLLMLLACFPGWGNAGTSAQAADRQTMTFVPGDRSRPVLRATPKSGRSVSAAPARPRAGGRIAGRGQENDETPAAIARPGQGFTLENGVLTYPAPARFQPQKLKHR